jgi:hypothetical protein
MIKRYDPYLTLLNVTKSTLEFDTPQSYYYTFAIIFYSIDFLTIIISIICCIPIVFFFFSCIVNILRNRRAIKKEVELNDVKVKDELGQQQVIQNINSVEYNRNIVEDENENVHVNNYVEEDNVIVDKYVVVVINDDEKNNVVMMDEKDAEIKESNDQKIIESDNNLNNIIIENVDYKNVVNVSDENFKIDEISFH